MRKVYLMASALIATGAINAQVTGEKVMHQISPQTTETRVIPGDGDRAPGDPIVQNQFNNAADWTNPADGNGNQWVIVSSTPAQMTQYWGSMASSTANNGFGLFNGIQYLLNSTVTAQDATIELTNSFSCAGIPSVTMEFEQRYRAFNSDQVFVEVSGNNGANWTQFEINTQLAGNGPTIQEVYRLDISSVVGNATQAKVRFRWQELGGDPQYGSGYGWGVDDLNIFESYDYDQQITGAYHRSGIGQSYATGLEYYTIPTSQITTIDFIGETKNLGGQIQTGAKLNVEVTGAGTYSGTSATQDIPVGGSDSLVCTTQFTPSAVGTYDVVYYFDGTNAEEVTDNDTIYDSFEVTDYTYGRDNGIATSSIGNVSSNDGSPLTIGNVMDIFADGVIGAVDVAITTDASNEGQLIYGQIVRWNDGAGTWDYLGQTDDHTITASENGGFVKMVFETPIQVYSGDLILILAGHYGGDPEVRFRLAQQCEEQTVLGFTAGSADPFYLSSPSSVMVRADMRDFTGIDNPSAQGFTIGQNIPNPFNNTSVINYTLASAAEVNVTITDVTGKVVKVINQGTQEAGSYMIELNGEEFAEGTYFYTFTVGNQVVTKSFVVTK